MCFSVLRLLKHQIWRIHFCISVRCLTQLHWWKIVTCFWLEIAEMMPSYDRRCSYFAVWHLSVISYQDRTCECCIRLWGVCSRWVNWTTGWKAVDRTWNGVREWFQRPLHLSELLFSILSLFAFFLPSFLSFSSLPINFSFFFLPSFPSSFHWFIWMVSCIED